MLLITTALMIEARPLCGLLGLKAMNGHPYPVFACEDTVLVVSGTGALNAAAATGWALGHFDGIKTGLNMGFAGAATSVASLYQWRYIHSIRDENSGHLCIPDILWNHPLEESALLTTGKVIRDDINWPGLVDMEGSGFFQAARRFLSPDRIVLLKWISDALTGEVDIKRIEEKYTASIQELSEFLEFIRHDMDKEAAVSSMPLMDTIREKLRLTRTQDLFLSKWLSGYLARGGDPEPVESLLPEKKPKHKTENTRLFEALKNVLKG
jgi:hypothetical protein